MKIPLSFLALLATAAVAAPPPPKVPRDAPYCALPETRPLFVAPMGEPFRGQRGAPWPSAAWAAGADRNHDGQIDKAEFTADALHFFRTLDRDHDGRLTPEEVDVYEREVAPEIALYQRRGIGPMPQRTRAPRAGESGYGGPLGAGEYAWLNVPEPVSSADADMNRVVDEKEFAAAASRRFNALDTTGAGQLRLADLPRTPLQMEIEGPCRPRPVPKRREREDRAFDDAPHEAGR